MSEKNTLDRINELDRDDFVARFGSLFEHSPWVAEEAWESRPFGSIEEMWRAFEDAMYAAPPERQLVLIRAHPDLAGKAAVAGELTQESAREQASAGLNRLSPEEFEEFTRMNREYREKFGLPMVVCVREHTKESILDNVQSRLANSRDEEIRTALAEISKISHYRLLDLVEREEER
ncbi:MAG: 2-oxo-4-hydroxy-4-carboxy-5-ureidoimidazoline decarboxylase [Actinomycetota bacterium]|nr:2-oxo-4-hydroxy-4-carboxy-5-ureidoimidazoline decarboxylase [Actinomycetota bacterium]